jgi:branched-chain amino acid aminotransferase
LGEPTDKLVHFEGRLVQAAEAKINALSPALTRGPIAYETIRGYWGRDRENLNLFRLGDHLKRLRASMRILRFQELFGHAEMTSWIVEVVRVNKFVDDVHLRMLVYPLDADGPGRTSQRSGVVIDAEPRPPRVNKPVSCRVSSWMRRGGDNHPARVKAVGLRVFSRVALAQANLDGYGDLIIQDERGKIVEATSSNLFIVRRGVLATPPVTDQILEGITRDTILALASDLGIACVERDVDRTELHDCEEAFLCSTGLEIVPIATVDGLAVGEGAQGQITNEVRNAYLSLVRGTAARHRDWLTPVH